MEINKAGAGQGMVALGLSPWVDYILPDRAPSAGVGHRTKTLHPDILAYFRTRRRYLWMHIPHNEGDSFPNEGVSSP